MMAKTIYEYDSVNELFVDTSKAKRIWTGFETVNIPFGSMSCSSGPNKFIDQVMYLSEKDNFYLVEKVYLTEAKKDIPVVNVIMLYKDYKKVITWLMDHKYYTTNTEYPEVIEKYYKEHFE